MENYNCLITWLGGSEDGRVCKGITHVTPKELYLLLEAKTSEWNEFQEESRKNIINHFGELYKSEERCHVVIIDLNGSSVDEYSKKIYTMLYDLINKIRKQHADADITLDITAAPKSILIVLNYVAMTLSTRKSPIKLQSVPKISKLAPIYYASVNSEYYSKYAKKENMISLSEYREMEKTDPGGDPIPISVTHNNFEILNPKDREDFKLLALFSALPSYKEKTAITSKEIGSKLYATDMELFNNVKEDDRSFQIWLGKNLKKLENLSVITLDRPDKSLIAKKNWTGDLISGATDKLHEELIDKHFKK